MKRDTILMLGDFEFSGLEIPAQIPFGGAQHLAVHKLIGGKRIIDAMGEDDAPLQWSGLFQGQSAHQRARYLDTLRVKGGALQLTWAEFKYQVVIKEFRAEYQRFYQIPYSITCEVQDDQTMEMNWIFDAPIDQAIADDMAAANGYGAVIGDGPLATLLGALDSAISSVSTFANAAQSQINSVNGPLAAVQSRVKLLIASSSNVIGNVTTFGGLIPGNKVSAAASKLTGMVAAVSQAGALMSLASVLGRMGGNLGAINKPGNTTTVAGGNMYSLAGEKYGDATAWTTIAKANGTTDPTIAGVQTLTIPINPDSGNGVLSA